MSFLDGLRADPFTPWYAPGYDLYSFDDAESFRRLVAARPGFDRIEVLAFVGLWCGDCQEHLPAFVRILDETGFPRERLKVYSLDRSKRLAGAEGLIASHRVTRLPTFIVLRDGAELGRITETPQMTLIADLARIFGTAP